MYVIILLFAALSQCTAVDESPRHVINITTDNYKDLVEDSEQVWMLQFYSPACQACIGFLTEYDDIAGTLQGIAKVGVVDGAAQQELTNKFEVITFPTIKIFSSHLSVPERYTGKFTPEKIVNRIFEVLRDKAAYQTKRELANASLGEVVQLTDANFNKEVRQSKDAWLVEFYAPWCGHCKNFAPEFASSAEEFEGQVKFGAVDATVNKLLASQYKIEYFPTIMYFPPGRKAKTSPVLYESGAARAELNEWLRTSVLPPPAVVQITDERTLKEACEKSLLCVVSFLPHILDCQATCREEYLDILRNLTIKFSNNRWGWVWTEAGVQKDIEGVLKVGGSGYPCMAVVNVRRLTYSLLRGPFSFEGISTFLIDLQHGKGQSIGLHEIKLPEIKRVPTWDGKDCILETMETMDETVIRDEL